VEAATVSKLSKNYFYTNMGGGEGRKGTRKRERGEKGRRRKVVKGIEGRIKKGEERRRKRGRGEKGGRIKRVEETSLGQVRG